MTNWILYADGSCHNNGKPDAKAGWGIVFHREGEHKHASTKGLVPGAQTNNRAELSAVINGIDALLEFTKGEPFELTVRTDSSYITNAVNNKWLHGWVKNKWRTKTNAPVQNIDLWMMVISRCRIVAQYGQKVKFEHVDGHSGDEFNDKADRLANEAAIAA